jgi:M6 family metalloprotease-like protein
MYIFGMLFLFGSATSRAQQVPVKRSHAISTPSAASSQMLPAIGTLDVIAVMVEFQPDSSELTSGTGIFGNNGMQGLPYLSRQEDTRVDPLPHDQSYFESHLEFARNYFQRSSDTQLNIDYRVLPEVYQLDKQMQEYSPIGEEFTTEKLALFLQDVWSEVEAQGGFDATGLDPETTAFVVFHAGVGRDIELTGTSLDITPYDIPSIYMREQNLENWLGADFEGFPINGGSFRVKNSMIIPRTESRRGEDITENEVVFPLSINGLLCASIGSHLGLPDLFNTETGDPAIGRFGLMDGAGFFSYNGLFPPEPSAWEKVFLGWENPFNITGMEGEIPVPYRFLNEDRNIVRYDLSSTEYYLIENRHRDPENDGVIITTRKPDGIEVQQTFTNYDTEFVFQESEFDTVLEAGTIIDVDNFDWSLPGGLDVGEDEEENTDDDRILNGGILIWHIDEALINQQLMNERVNADPQRRGVDLEEGDGAQDIGLDAGLLDNSPSFGFPFDFWWSGNDYKVITQTGSIDLNPENRFGPDTYPNNNSNSGARSFFEFYDFSDNLPQASFHVRNLDSEDFGYTEVVDYQTGADVFFTPSDSYWDYYPMSLAVKETDTDTLLVIPSFDQLFVLDHLNPQVSIAGNPFAFASMQQPFLGDLIVTAPNPSTSGQMEVTGMDYNGVTQWTTTVDANDAFLSSQNGSQVTPDFTSVSISVSDGSVINDRPGSEFRSEVVNNSYVSIQGNAVNIIGEDIPQYISGATERLYGGTIRTNQDNRYYLFEDGAFSLINPEQQDPFTLIFEEEKAEWPAITDDLQIFRINKRENTLEGYNANGALLANTPISAPDSIHFIGTPLLADITGDNVQDIIVVGQDDYSVNIFAYEMTGQLIQGFPLYVGGAIGRNIQPIHPAFYGDMLYAVSHNGDIKAWQFLDFTSAQWPSRYGKNPYNKVSGDIEIETDDTGDFDVLNPEETYNWPNPADDVTNIRFELAAPGGTVELTVIDYSGRIIFEQTVTSQGGNPEEIQITTSSWGSGAYFARLKATVDGRSESKLIKIGVLH